jgi:hypothetical protein
MTPGQARYWLAQQRQMAGRVTLIDPWRKPLRELRKTHPGHIVYRASTGGRWGKSASTVRL